MVARGTPAERPRCLAAPWPRPPLLLGRRRLGRRLHRIPVTDRRLAFVVFVVLILHGHPDPDVLAVLEVQRVVGVGVGREPILAVDLLAIGLDLGESLVATL